MENRRLSVRQRSRSICGMAFDVQSLHLSTEGKAEPVQLTFCRVSPA